MELSALRPSAASWASMRAPLRLLCRNNTASCGSRIVWAIRDTTNVPAILEVNSHGSGPFMIAAAAGAPIRISALTAGLPRTEFAEDVGEARRQSRLLPQTELRRWVAR